MLLALALTLLVLETSSSTPDSSVIRCDFETKCGWDWNRTEPHGFRVVSGQDVDTPSMDASKDVYGHFLLLRLQSPLHEQVQVWSPLIENTDSTCSLEVWMLMHNMSNANLRLVFNGNMPTVARDEKGNNHGIWEKKKYPVGRMRQPFNVILEVVPDGSFPAIFALDNLQLKDCFRTADEPQSGNCNVRQFQCHNNLCIKRDKVCDLHKDCPTGEDEQQDCDKLPSYSHCTFEEDWCGWTNRSDKEMRWIRKMGEAEDSGAYAYVNTSMIWSSKPGRSMGADAVLESPVFHPPPCYHSRVDSPRFNSCSIRFSFYIFGASSAALEVKLVELLPHDDRISRIFWFFSKNDVKWLRTVAVLPNVTHRYLLQFHAVKGIARSSNFGLDNISMSPECFGIGVPPEETDGYVYNSTYCYGPVPYKVTNENFFNRTMYSFSTCGAKGREGPTPENCTKAYQHTLTNVTVLPDGIQRWTVPEGGYYTIIAKGASGGSGLGGGSSSGAIVRSVIELDRGQHIYILVGQEGTKGRKKSRTSALRDVQNPLGSVRNLTNFTYSAGGGGGGTFVFLNRDNRSKPLIVAAGGGGLSHKDNGHDDGIQHGHGYNSSRGSFTGSEFGHNPAGAGGGWQNVGSMRKETGQAFLDGAGGGKACYENAAIEGSGGFGGGGGGCAAGGGGGGFSGGNAWSEPTRNGEGGYSYYSAELSAVEEGQHHGPGAVIIIPALDKACSCDYRCVALDEYRSDVSCICPEHWILGENKISCLLPPEPNKPDTTFIAVLMGTGFGLLVGLGLLCFCLYNRYQRNKTAIHRRRMLSGPDLQLNRLREASDSMMTEFNPNYEFGGGTYTIRDLKDIPRDHLRLVKALGQGAFGEVYQGFFRHRAGDAVEMPVAVKTLPELSTHQAETDFLMEALIMSKFNHPNIVHFIGVCFDKHPRFIVLELLAGGDLKTFLRESRPKPERPSPLTMKDLLMCAMDVAKGCRYMEQNRFIHRDIAARNCLLTTKGPGRVVKIADFGMARDIYRADYYRKGGKAMLPIKWMPPEAFLDGIFTSKTDVWSFGVLLWEVMSLGYMPYTGCANKEVMDLVTSGGRLEPPSNCPGPLYGIMTQCWHPTPDERPNFSTIMERLGYCLQDPDVMNAPLPVFHRPPSAERDATIMRPPAHENSCLLVQQRAADYLVPRAPPELPSSPSTSSVDKLLAANSTGSDWETSFVLPESRSTQPLLEEASTSSSSSSTEKPATVGSLVSLNNNNNNNNNNPQRNSLKASLSLDPAALAKQQPLPYVNVNMTPSHAADQEVESQGRPFTVQAALLSENEISC